jgi:8-amino-7-oxononanoate synthase
MNWNAWVQSQAREIERAGRWRSMRDLDGFSSTTLLMNGSEIISFASNDYLGLASHPEVIAAAHRALESWGCGTGSARLLAGSRPVHSTLERELAEWKMSEAALLFPSGYTTNLGVLTTLADGETLICSDELNHASIVDGCRLAKGRVEVYPHNDLAAVERLLARNARAVVVTDAVFSMDGDRAPVDELGALCRAHGALLVIDEAHAVLDPPTRHGGDVLRVGTLSKTLGSQGGFVAGPRSFIDLIVNRARPFIFTTASAPAAAAGALEALSILRSAEGQRLRTRLRAVVDRFAPGHPSPIVSILLGDEH